LQALEPFVVYKFSGKIYKPIFTKDLISVDTRSIIPDISCPLEQEILDMDLGEI